MKQIPLSQYKFSLVDDEDYDFLMQWKWSALQRGRLYHARRTYYLDGYIPKINPVVKRVYMHRLILGISDPKVLVDHINGDGLDNRKANLRICTMSQNGMNRGAPIVNTSGYKGVTKCGNKKWTAVIVANRKRFSLGVFDTAELAAHAYDKAARMYHGEFAKTNFK